MLKRILKNIYLICTLACLSSGVAMTRFNWDHVYFSQKSVPEKNGLSKIGHDFRKQGFQKLKLAKNVKTKKYFP